MGDGINKPTQKERETHHATVLEQEKKRDKENQNPKQTIGNKFKITCTNLSDLKNVMSFKLRMNDEEWEHNGLLAE